MGAPEPSQLGDTALGADTFATLAEDRSDTRERPTFRSTITPARWNAAARGKLNARETTTYAASQREVDGQLAMGVDDPLAQYMGAGVGDVLVVEKAGQRANCAQRRLVVTGHSDK